jgi:hypothetical protein
MKERWDFYATIFVTVFIYGVGAYAVYLAAEVLWK